jgi:hypothetical protein
MANVAVVFPAATVTEFGSETDFELLVSVTFIPPRLATAVRVTVPVEPTPPATVLGETVTDANSGGVIVKMVDLLRAPCDAIIVADCWLATGLVLTTNVAELLPAATVTEAGTETSGLLQLRAIRTPPDPATQLKVAVPTRLVPPTTVVGLTLTDESPAGVIVSTADALAPPADASIVAVVFEFTPVVVTRKVAFDAPLATNTVAGAATMELLEFSATTAPPDGAARERVTVPVETDPA